METTTLITKLINFVRKNAVLILLIVITLLYFYDKKQNRLEQSRLLNNQTALAKGILSMQKTYSRSEFKEYYPEFKRLLSEYGIKINKVDHYIQTSYNLVDSPIVSHYTRIDSFPDTRFFTVYDNCYEISGISYKDSIITQAFRHDTLSTFLYRQTNKDIFFAFRWWHKVWDGIFYNDGWHYKAITVSSCNNDTLQVNDNVKIRKGM